MQHAIPGINSFLQLSGPVKNLRYALVTNDAAFTSDGILSRMALKRNGFNLIKIFSPEHGISVQGADGVYQDHQTDIVSGLPIISLYGDRLTPSEEDLADIDVVLFDIPDVGCRFYTYLWTMTYVMEACTLYNKQFIILDRPNPINGNLDMAEGPMLDEANCSSFIGRWSIPIRHSCTLGELALYFTDKKFKILDVKVVTAKNWERSQIIENFRPTSPAIQNIETALVYPGMGLLEGINVNEGRGTAHPFIRFGAPWINAEELKIELKNKYIFGFDLKTCSYVPTDSLYKNKNCYGLELDTIEKDVFHPVVFGIELINALIKLYPEHVQQRAYVTNVNPTGGGHLDRLLGIKNAFELFKSNASIETDVSDDWPEEIAPFLLYK